MGNLIEWCSDIDPEEQQKKADPAKELQQKWARTLTQGSTMKDNDAENWDGKTWSERTPEETIAHLDKVREMAPNPNCRDSLCNPSYWIRERNLCLFCGHRG